MGAASVGVATLVRSALRDPLTHFLGAGVGLFLLFYAVGPDGALDADSNVIVVDREALLTFMQYRSRAFDRSAFETRLDEMPPRDLDLLIDDYVREEALYREALALGLDTDDYIIRRRLVQKIEFISRGFAEASVNLDGAQLETFFEENKDDYAVAATVTFTHVFFDAEKRGAEGAFAAAALKVAELNTAVVPFADAPKHGDRFLYHLNYVERTSDYVASHFGPAMAAKLFELPAETGVWRGPFLSPYGVHLVMVTRREAGRLPELQEVRGRVEEDARQMLARERTDAAAASIVGRYDVRVTFSQPAAPDSLAESE